MISSCIHAMRRLPGKLNICIFTHLATRENNLQAMGKERVAGKEVATARGERKQCAVVSSKERA